MKTNSLAGISGEDFSVIAEHIQDYALFLLSPDGTVVSWNVGAQRLKGYSSEEILGQHFSCFYTESDLKSGKPAHGLEAASANGRFEAEGWRVRKDGSHFWANVVITPIRTDDGNTRGFAKITRDFTERKRVEEALHSERQLLQTLVTTFRARSP